LKTIVGIRDAIAGLQALPGATLDSVTATVNYYGSKIIDRHFKPGNDKQYNYKPLTPQYLKRKIKKYGKLPTLVASGKLRASVLATARARRKGKRVVLTVNAPRYGYYQIEDHQRDWLRPNERDIRDLRRFMARWLKKKRFQALKGVLSSRRRR